jgi:hypothetical protein
MNCPCPVRSRPEASPLIHDLSDGVLGKENQANASDQAHVKFADGEEHEIPFPCSPEYRKDSPNLFACDSCETVVMTF